MVCIYQESIKTKITYMMPKVSIVVPVHNAGQYLHRCIDSLVSQTLVDIEIVLVLDVPTDGSDKVAESYANLDARIKLVYNSVNLHIGLSRNAGLNASTGEYIGFCDHDDYCELDMFEKLYAKAIEDSADIVVSNFFDEWDDEVAFFNFPQGLSDKEFQAKMFSALIAGKYSRKNTESFSNANVIWNQIFRKDFLLNNHLELCDNRIVTMEDVLFNIKTHFYAQQVSFVPEAFYHHINNSHNSFDKYEYRSLVRIIAHITEIYTFLNHNNVWDEHKSDFAVCTLRRLYTSYRNELKFKGMFSSFAFFVRVRNHSQIQQILSLFKFNPQLLHEFSATKKVFLKFIVKS